MLVEGRPRALYAIVAENLIYPVHNFNPEKDLDVFLTTP